jgi:hypothetical protein
MKPEPLPRPQPSLRLFRCGMDEKKCIRKEHPGWHRSFEDASRCVAQTAPAKYRRFMN